MNSSSKNYMNKTYPKLAKICNLMIKDTKNYLLNPKEVDLIFTHGHLMHLPESIIDDICKTIDSKKNKYIFIREALINNPAAGLIRKLKYRRFRFDRDYSNKFQGFKIIYNHIVQHPFKKWVRQGEYFLRKFINIL